MRAGMSTIRRWMGWLRLDASAQGDRNDRLERMSLRSPGECPISKQIDVHLGHQRRNTQHAVGLGTRTPKYCLPIHVRRPRKCRTPPIQVRASSPGSPFSTFRARRTMAGSVCDAQNPRARTRSVPPCETHPISHRHILDVRVAIHVDANEVVKRRRRKPATADEKRDVLAMRVAVADQQLQQGSAAWPCARLPGSRDTASARTASRSSRLREYCARPRCCRGCART